MPPAKPPRTHSPLSILSHAAVLVTLAAAALTLYLADQAAHTAEAYHAAAKQTLRELDDALTKARAIAENQCQHSHETSTQTPP